MDFSPTEAQVELAGLTRAILSASRDLPAAVGVPASGMWADLAAAGILAATLPTPVGGDGLGLPEQGSILIELGRAASGLPFLPSIVVAASALAEFGAPDWAARAGRGEVLLTAALAPHTVTLTDGLLSGECPAVPVPDFDAILIPTSDGVFLVARSADGVSAEPEVVAGGPGSTVVHLEGAAPVATLPADAAGWMRLRYAVGLAATQLGVLERLLEITAEYARTRVQFGKAIGSFQAVAQRLADAYIDVEGVRLTTWQAIWALATGQPGQTEVAVAKFWAADAGHRVAHTGVHIHGGVGLDMDNNVQRYFLAAKYNEFLLGGATAQLLTIGDALAAATPAR